MEGYPVSATFAEVPAGASADRRAAPPSDWWSIHGFHMRIPPLYDQMHMMQEEARPGAYATYAQWAHAAQRTGAASGGGAGASGVQQQQQQATTDGAAAAPQEKRPRGRPPLNKTEGRAKERGPTPEQGGGDGGRSAGGGSAESEERKRAWSVVVRRDILRQQRAIVTQQKEMLTTCKRTALACQKEVRKKALRGQKLNSMPQIQMKCKRLGYVPALWGASRVRTAADACARSHSCASRIPLSQQRCLQPDRSSRCH